MLIAGCGSKNISPFATEEPDLQFPIAKSDAVARENPTAFNENISKQAESINKFAVAMYNQLKKDGKNLFMSPYSITAALAMTAAGACGDTKQQILDALQVDLEGVAFDQAINAIDQSITDHGSTTEGISLSIINSTWLQSGWNFKVSYLDHLSRYYGAGVNLVDFMEKPEECRQIINAWVADQTNDKILNLLPEGSIHPVTRVVLTNAIYFFGDWLYAFNSEYTSSKKFMLLDNSIVQAPVMSLNKPDSTVIMLYARGSGFRALDFPYKGGRIAMTVLFPDSGSFTSVENALSAAMLKQVFASLQPETLEVSLPKYKFTYGTDTLRSALKHLGMIDAFDPNRADLSGIDGSRTLYVDNVYHKAFISVDEKGTEAAAATAVVIDWRGPEKPVFKVDRPFIFMIRDKEAGTILFMGRILNPLITE